MNYLMNLLIEPMTVEDVSSISSNLEKDFDNFWTASILEKEVSMQKENNSFYFVVKEPINVITVQEDFSKKYKSKVCTSTLSHTLCSKPNNILAFAGILIIIDEVNIMNIVVRKDKRNLKIASSLLSKILEFSNEKGFKSVTLEVNENNLPAIALYEKYHFEKVGLRKNYYNGKDNAIIMTLKL